MARSTEPRRYPTSDDPVARFEAVVRRGRSIQRRQQVVTGAGTGGAVAASALAVGFLVGGRGADQVRTDGTDTTETAAVVTIPRASTVPDAVVDPSSSGIDVTTEVVGRTVTITVTDPHQPAVEGAQACATVDVTAASGPGPVLEGRSCDPEATDTDLTPLVLERTDGTAVVCAAVVERGTPTTAETLPLPLPADPASPTSSTPGHVTTTRSVRHRFTTEIPKDLPNGRYELRIIATSGVGDGCDAPVEGSTELERSSDTVIDLKVG